MTRTATMIVLTALAAAAGITRAGVSAQTPPSTDIYELTFDGTADGLAKARVQPVAAAPGYQNQPFYTPDGAVILFTAAGPGGQTDIHEFSRASRTTKPLITTPEGEYSPTVTPDGKGISVIRVEADKTQRLWRFDRAGKNPQLVLKDIKPVGYHVWVDEDRLVLFVLGPPATLHSARVTTGKSAVHASDIGRSLQRIPRGRQVSFVSRAVSPGAPPGDYWVRELNPETGAILTLTKAVDGGSDRDCAWLPDGTLLMSAGTKIFAWRQGAGIWREVFDGSAHKLGALTRMAVAPDGKAMAIVVSESPAPAPKAP